MRVSWPNACQCVLPRHSTWLRCFRLFSNAGFFRVTRSCPGLSSSVWLVFVVKVTVDLRDVLAGMPSDLLDLAAPRPERETAESTQQRCRSLMLVHALDWGIPALHVTVTLTRPASASRAFKCNPAKQGGSKDACMACAGCSTEGVHRVLENTAPTLPGGGIREVCCSVAPKA